MPGTNDNAQGRTALAKILIVDDEENIVSTLKYNLVKQGYSVLTAGDGKVAIDVARREKPDLIVLDVMLPGMSGLDVCRILRQETIVPILMLTARESDIDKVVGLELGADDYLTKPFNLPELIARIRAMLRRMQMIAGDGSVSRDGEVSDMITVGNLTINLTQHHVNLNGDTKILKPKEFDLLSFMARHKGQVLTRETLLDRVWGYGFSGGTRTVDVHIRWLREKLEPDPAHPRYLHTIFGVGYKFDPGETDAG